MRPASVLANLLILLTFGVAALLHTHNEPLYYLAVQEDQYLEWATFWGFIVAGGIYLGSATHQFKASRQLPWFVFGLSLFCFLVAMEESKTTTTARRKASLCTFAMFRAVVSH